MPANESEINQEIIIEPKNFNEAWFHSDPIQKDKWRKTILIDIGIWTLDKYGEK